jgi:hypothetical protein
VALIIAFPGQRAVMQLTDERLRYIAKRERELERLLDDAYDDLDGGAEYVGTDLRLDPRDHPQRAVVLDGEEWLQRKSRR